jgi:hypothetical protein
VQGAVERDGCVRDRDAHRGPLLTSYSTKIIAQGSSGDWRNKPLEYFIRKQATTQGKPNVF